MHLDDDKFGQHFALIIEQLQLRLLLADPNNALNTLDEVDSKLW
jgi:hypothetical protein